jgi:Flp pilus assembly protein TadD
MIGAMRTKPWTAGMLVAGLIGLAAPAASATPADNSAPPVTEAAPVPRGAIPDPETARRAMLDKLFERLRQADSPSQARPIEGAIVAVLDRSDSPSIELLMTRGATLMHEGDLDGSLTLYTAVTKLAPRYAAGWRQRGIAEARRGDGPEARDSLRKALELEPRDIATMSNLGNVLEQMDDSAGALQLYRRLLSLDPNVEGVAARAKALEAEVEGRSI